MRKDLQQQPVHYIWQPSEKATINVELAKWSKLS